MKLSMQTVQNIFKWCRIHIISNFLQCYKYCLLSKLTVFNILIISCLIYILTSVDLSQYSVKSIATFLGTSHRVHSKKEIRKKRHFAGRQCCYLGKMKAKCVFLTKILFLNQISGYFCVLTLFIEMLFNKINGAQPCLQAQPCYEVKGDPRIKD